MSFRPVRFEELMRGPEKFGWLIEGIAPETGIGFIAGRFGTGKSWLTQELVLAVATGTKWLRRFEVRQGPVLVIDEENAEQLLVSRYAKLLRGRRIETHELPIYYAVKQLMDFTPGRDGEAGEKFIELARWVDEHRPALILADSLTRIHRADENSASEMSKVFGLADRLAKAAHCVVMFTHHAPHSGDRMRGSVDIYGVADWSLFVTKRGAPPNEVLMVTQDKARWDVAVEPFSVRITGDAHEMHVNYVGETEQVVASGAQKILDALVSRPGHKAAAEELRAELDMPDRTFRRHQQDLSDLGLIVLSQHNKRNYVSLPGKL